MGITGLPQLINSKTNGKAIKKRNFSYFQGKVIAVDISILVYKTGIVARSTGHDMVNENGGLTSHLHGTFYKILQFLENGITPIIVFDGKAPDIKNKTHTKRRNIKDTANKKLKEISDTTSTEYIKFFKQTFSPKKEDFIEVQIMLDLMGIPYIVAPGEADVVLAWLTTHYDKHGNLFAMGICSEDSDMLVHGAPYLFKDMFSAMNKSSENQVQVTVISLQKTLDKMDVTMEQFIDLCVLMGCDFSERIKNVGPVAVYSLIQSKKNIKDIIIELKEKSLTNNKIQINDDDVPGMFEARDYFRNAVNELDEMDDFVLTQHNIRLRLYQYDELMDFMCTKHNFNPKIIESGIKKMAIYYANMNIVRKNTKMVHQILQLRIESDEYTFLSSEED